MTVALPTAPEMVAVVPCPQPAISPTLDEIKARAKAIKKHRKHEGRRIFHGLCWCLHAIGFSF